MNNNIEQFEREIHSIYGAYDWSDVPDNWVFAYGMMRNDLFRRYRASKVAELS